MGCVNRNGKEFKALAARNNVAINTLELITHKYWLETGNETKFPTDVYIQAQLGNVHYLEKGPSVRKLWGLRYNSPKEFSSMRTLQSAIREAEKYFPKSAILYYKNSKGNYILSVKRPVAKEDYSKDEFFKEYDKAGSVRDIKVLNLGLKEGQTYGIGKVQELFNKFNTDKTTKDLADRAFNLAKDLGLKISFTDNFERFGVTGQYKNDNTIKYKKSFLERDTMNDKKAPLLLHEVLHALSMYALSDRSKNWEKSEAIESFRTEINSLYNELKGNEALKGERGIVNVYEFVAELSNPIFREKIKSIDRNVTADKALEKKSFWRRIIDAFKNLLGLHVTNTYYQRSMNALEKALDAFDIDTYMRYNGIKKPLRDGYNAKEWEFNSMSDAEVKSNVKDYLDKQVAKERGVRLTDIKPEYKGKLIYAQSGTGKSTIADNITVFDSDYLLGQVLGVSPETAGFFFGRLSASQKKAFGKQYRDAIKQKIAEGYTVVTANESLLPEADVVVYNSSAKQTDERVNREDRAINNRYHAIDYHKSTLSKIKELRNNDKENKKEYRELDNGHYLSDIISSDPSIFHNTSSDLYGNSKQKESNSRLREEVIADFLNEFGITVHTISNYNGELPLFDALNRVINAKEPSDITDGVGYAIAFMMQGDPEMQRMVVESHFGMKGDFDKRVPIINKKLKNLHPNQHSPIAKEILKEVGTQIATELRNNFDSDIEDVKSDKSIWKVIKNFFKKLGMSIAAFGHRGSVQKSENLFVKDIIAALGREDYSRIRGPRIKEGTNELAQRVDVETALKENPYEDSIIRKLGEYGIALAGSTSIALQGSLFRPSENPLHDIDFNSGNNSSKESLDKLLPQIFPEGTIQFSHALKKDKNGDQTVTYITLSEPFEIRKTGFDTADLYSKDGRLLGKRKHYDLELADGVQGKMLDFFTGPTQESNHGFYNQTINGHNYLLSESNAAMAAKILWARPKDMWDYKYFKKNDFINSLSGKELKEELSLIQHESADYDMLNGIEEEHKHSGKAIPQDFTFADGTTIKAPFRPNAQQVDALNEMDKFIKSNETSMTLSGYAGTGKTSLMEMIAKKSEMQHRPVIFCASTNKAAAVLNERVRKSGFKAETLHKIFGIQVAQDEKSLYYNTKNLKNSVKRLDDINIEHGTTVIIDEASMINEENYDILNRVAKAKNLKIIYVGDEAQLAPVGEDKISKVFRNGEGKVIRLTQVERTDDNAILKEATDIRNGKPLSGESSFNSKGEGVAYITPSDHDTVDEVIGHYAKGLKDNPNHFRILAFTNKAVSEYNNKVREILGYTTPAPVEGEPMTGYANLRYDWRTKTYEFVNSESYKVYRSYPAKKKSIRIDGVTYTMEAHPIDLEDPVGHIVSFDYMDIKNNESNREAAKAIGKKKKELWVAWKKATTKDAKSNALSDIHILEEFLFVNDEIKDEQNIDPETGQHPTLVDKAIDFGYAMTVHKSQGSTFTNVLIDDIDIAKGTRNKSSNPMDNAMAVVDLGIESDNDPSNAEMISSEDVELVIPDNAPIEAKKSDNQAADLKQQLEYVAVSRATDTVTVISNNVKKEGSPLHPEKAIKEDNNRLMNKNQNNESNSTRNAATSSEQQQTSNGGLLADAQSRIKRGSRTSGEAQKQGILSKEALDKRNQEDRKSLEEFAKEQGKWVNDVDTKLERKYGKRIGHGSEAWVYLKDKNTVIKSRSLTGYETVQDALRSIELHNKLFPETAMKVVGFGESDGEFTVVMEQPYIADGTFATNEDIATFIKGRFKDTEEDPSVQGNTSYKNNEYLLQDLKPQNVIVKVTNGEKQFYVIDGDFYDNPSFAEGESQMVNLPNYQQFNELYDEVPVDAEWKVSYLKELDAQMNTEKSQEEKQNLIDQMNNVLHATSESEYKQEANSTKEKEIKKTLDNYEKLTQQLNRLLEGDEDLEELYECPLSATEVRHTAELVANYISDLITQLQQEKGLAEEQYPSLKTELDFQKASRKEIVETVGINRLIERAKMVFDSERDENSHIYDNDYLAGAQADVIFDCWDAIMYLAADVFAMNEGFGITCDFAKGLFTTTDKVSIDYDNFNNYENDKDVIGENEKDEQEHWQIESRCIDVLNAMSALVRKGLHECYLLNEDGSKVMSKWGIPERVNPRDSVNSILRWTQGSRSLDDMIKKLSAKQKHNTWLSQLITRLSDTSGEETDFQSQFYNVFSKAFQNYSIVLLEDGKYHSIPVNSHPALTEAIDSIKAQFKAERLSLFNAHKINMELLGSKDTVDSKDFNLYKAYDELLNAAKSIPQGEGFDEKSLKVVAENVVGVCRLLGYNITEDLVDELTPQNVLKMATALEYMHKKLVHANKELTSGEIKSYDAFKYKGEDSIDGNVKNFLSPITEKLEDTAVNAFYDSGKMYQSYVTPSFLTNLMNKFKLEGDEFRKFIEDTYASSEWFKLPMKNGKEGKWRNAWLSFLGRGRGKNVFDHKVELNFNKHNYMRNMSDPEYVLSLITEYFSVNSDANENMAEAWFRVPMQSNKPSSDFIKFYSWRGEKYKKTITGYLHDTYLQEVSRIQTIRMRNLDKHDSAFIKNFDSNGRKFNFLPVLNAYLEDTDIAKSKRKVLRNEDGSVSADNDRCAELLQQLIKGEKELTSDEGAELNRLIDDVIEKSTEDRVQSILDKWERNGILEAAKSIKDIYPSSYNRDLQKAQETKDAEKIKAAEDKIKNHIRAQVENFLWNDHLASQNILQLTITDIAFYKDAEDLQKRLSQLHAPGNRGNINATDYKGDRVSDGKYRTFILKDFDSFRSNIIDNISEVFDRKIAAEKDPIAKKTLIDLKDSLVRKPGTLGKDDKGGKYWNINVTDAQGYCSPSSYRKKAIIFGRWSKDSEKIYQKLLHDEANYEEIEKAFQPLKPFVYTKLTKNMGVDNAPITSMQVPFQAKNSEYLLVMADAILKGESLSRPNLLRAVFRVMEESERLCPTKGIDTVQFESAIKSGLQGAIDITQYRDMEGGEEAAYTFMMNQIFKEEYKKDNSGINVADADGNNIRDYKTYNTDVFVAETSYDDYCLQQEVPEHFKDHEQSHGSQIRMIIPSDLDFYNYDENGNQIDNYYEWTEPDGTVKRLKADEFRKEYEKTIADNIAESIAELKAELHLDPNSSRKEKNIALSKILQREILSSPRYGVDLVQACSIDKETGEFRIPKGDPIQAKRIEQLINSIIKNRVNKQKIAGGPIVQVSNFGTSQQLHIRFKDKSQKDGLIPLKEDYAPSEHNGMSYKEYVKINQGGIAYFEVYAPCPSKEIYDKFSNPDGTINFEALEATCPELLKMVSYRIPTEDKYSCAPMKVVGFMPREAGDAIMLPYELTEIDDSDFDIDKRYVMRKTFPPLKGKEQIRVKRRGEIQKELFNRACESYAAAHKGQINKSWVGTQVNMFLDNPQRMKNTDDFMRSLYKEYQSIAYYIEAPTSGRAYRDNKIVDMTYAVLTNEMTADKILNPGGFDAPKKMGYMVAAYKSDTNNLSWEELQGKSIDELKKLSYTDKDLTFADTQVQFYKQNSAASSLIGVFAVNKVAHATLESNNIWLDVTKTCGDEPFNIGGHYEQVYNPETKEYEKKIVGGKTFKGRMKVDTRYDSNGNLIGKTLGSLVSASADAVKDPILNLMNVNMTTAGMLNTMLRLGMTFDDAALFLSQDVIERMLGHFNKKNLNDYVSLDKIIEEWMQAYREEHHISDDSVINTQPLTKEELIEGLTSKEHDAIDYKVLLAYQKLKNLTEDMRNLTFTTRFNSISSAVGPLIIDNIILRHKMDKFLEENCEDGTHFYQDEHEDIPVDMTDVFADHPILKQFAETVKIAEQLFSDMPAGCDDFKKILKKIPKDISEKVYGDKKLLDELSNFYQSYLLIQSGVVNPKKLGYYINEFPKEFMKKKSDKEYASNELVKAIKFSADKSGKPFLTIRITGVDEQVKERLRSAWIDLHKKDPALSQDLFNYSFFVAGIGFSPKTFMSLVPTFVKERLKSEDGSASYVDTYRHFPSIIPDIVVDQFIRNHWDNNKLVPWRTLEKKGVTQYVIDYSNGILKGATASATNDLTGLSYFKLKVGSKVLLLSKKEGSESEFEIVKPLGNNGEYLEMSLSKDKKTSLSDTPQVTENNTTSELKTDSPAESDSNDTSETPTVTTTQTTKAFDDFISALMKKNPEYDREVAVDLTLNRIRGHESLYGGVIQKVYEHGGMQLTRKEAISKYKEMMEEFEKMC